MLVPCSCAAAFVLLQSFARANVGVDDGKLRQAEKLASEGNAILAKYSLLLGMSQYTTAQQPQHPWTEVRSV